MEDSKNTIQVVTLEGEHESRGAPEWVTRALDLDQLHAQMMAFIIKLHDLVTFEERRESDFRLETVEFSAEISAEGEFKLMGVGGSAGATGTIKFVMKRKGKESVPPVP